MRTVVTCQPSFVIGLPGRVCTHWSVWELLQNLVDTSSVKRHVLFLFLSTLYLLTKKM